MIALAKEYEEPERRRDVLDLEHSREDLRMVGALAKKGLLSAERMVEMIDRLENTAKVSEREALRVRADQTLATMQVQLLKLLKDISQGQQAQPTHVVNQQVNFYLPENGRENPVIDANGNGRH